MTTKRWLATIGACVLLAGLTAACGGSSSSSGGSGSGATYTVGLLTDESGLGASEYATAVAGLKAAVGVAGTEGYKIKYVVGDTQTSPGGALSAAQKLVEQDHVFAVLAVSSLTFAASTFLTQHGVPVIGADIDGNEWQDPSSTNMFSVIGVTDYSKVTTTDGLLLKQLGVTTYGGIGYEISPSSSKATIAAALSSQAAGLKVGYYDSKFAFGGTNVQPDAIAMKNHGVDGLVANVVPSTSFALISALKQLGADLKAAILLTGYGGDLLNAGSATVQAAQGDYFVSEFEPVENGDAASKKLQGALKTYAGVNDDPTFGQYLTYVSLDAFIQGLKAAGAKPTQRSLITALSGIHAYTAAGLYGGKHTVDLASKVQTDPQCQWLSKLTGTTFHPVSGLDPICGKIIPGTTVPSS